MPGRFAALSHPALTGAVAVLAVNDQVLKARFGGWWTGKLSDFAGVFVIGVLGGMLTRRPRLAMILTGVLFAAMKLLAPVGPWLAPLLGGAVRRDGTDLVALAALWPAYNFVMRVGGIESEPSVGRTLLVLASSVAVVLSVTATSCGVAPVLDALVVNEDGSVLARIADVEYDPTGERRPVFRWARSDDGGHDWQPTAAPATSQVPAVQEACNGARCFRLAGGDGVEGRSGAGAWRTDFALTGDQRATLRSRNRRESCGTDESLHLGALAAVRVQGELHVIAAADENGVLHRRPDGRWESRSVLDLNGIPLRGPPRRLARLPFLALGGLVALPVLVLTALRRLSWRRSARALLTAVLLGVGLVTVASGLLVFAADWSITGPLIVYLTVGVFALSVALALSLKTDAAE
jgi:hypothetical protein